MDKTIGEWLDRFIDEGMNTHIHNLIDFLKAFDANMFTSIVIEVEFSTVSLLQRQSVCRDGCWDNTVEEIYISITSNELESYGIDPKLAIDPKSPEFLGFIAKLRMLEM